MVLDFKTVVNVTVALSVFTGVCCTVTEFLIHIINLLIYYPYWIFTHFRVIGKMTKLENSYFIITLLTCNKKQVTKKKRIKDEEISIYLLKAIIRMCEVIREYLEFSLSCYSFTESLRWYFLVVLIIESSAIESVDVETNPLIWCLWPG